MVKYKSLLLGIALILFAFTSINSTSQTHNPSADLKEQLRYHPDSPTYYIGAHRGGRKIPNYPENALQTFKFTLQTVPNAFIELDVNMTKDGTLVLMHDESIDRTTTMRGKIKQLYWDEIKDAFLMDDFGKTTSFKIPTFVEVLKWAKYNNVKLQVDVKRGVPYSKVLDLVQQHDMLNQSIFITYSLKGVQQVYNHNPNAMISVSIRNMEEWERFNAINIPYENVIAFTGTTLSDPELYNTLHKNGILCILGTLGNLDNMAKNKNDDLYAHWAKMGIDFFATDRPGAVQKALRKVNVKEG